MMVSDDSSKLFKDITEMDAEKQTIQAQIGLNAYLIDGEITWTPEEREDFLRRAENACREAFNWFAEKIKARA